MMSMPPIVGTAHSQTVRCNIDEHQEMNEIIDKILANPIKSITITIAILGLMFGILRYRLAKRKSFLDVKEYNDRNKRFNIYLVDFYRVIDEETKFLIFHIKLTNRANAKHSYSASLELSYLTPDKNINTILLPHQPKLFENIKHQNLIELDENIRLNEREGITGWLIFKLPEHLQKTRIKKYNILITDTEDTVLNIETYISKDIVYGDKKV